jgi:DNA repair photolyase
MSTQALLRFSPAHQLPAPRGAALDFVTLDRGRVSGAVRISLDRRRGSGSISEASSEAALDVALRQVERTLERAREKARSARIEIGGLDLASEPYPEEERFTPQTGPLLERLEGLEGLQLRLCTRSPLLLRDLDLLRRLDHHHSVTVRVPLASPDPSLARALEGPTPLPQARLRLVEQVAAAGLAAEIVYGPILPDVNDDERSLAGLFRDARRAGARDVIPHLLALRPTARRGFLRWLDEELPEVSRGYRRMLDFRGRLGACEAEHVLAVFRRLRLEHGFPRTLPGRG